MRSSDKMVTFTYGHEESRSLDAIDLYRCFNNYRIWKYIIAALLVLNKTQLSEYKILEPGCGGGEKLRFLTELRAKPENCYGLDTSKRAIDLCKYLSPSTMNFQVGSVFDLAFENNTFDIIICSGLFCCFNDDNDIKRISKALKRVIKDDGIFFIVDINENFPIIYEKIEVTMQKKLRYFDCKKGELEHLLSNDFDLFRQSYIFGQEGYYVSGDFAQLVHLPLIDNKMDREEYVCAYSLWSFLTKKNYS